MTAAAPGGAGTGPAAPAPLAVSIGEPSGIGPDIVLLARLLAASQELPPFFVIGDAGMIAGRARRLGRDVPVATIADPAETAAAFAAGALPVLPLVNAHDERPGVLDPYNAPGTIEAIDRGTRLCLSGGASALVTAPIHKKALYDAGFRHPGHTEYLADLCGTILGRTFRPVMLMWGPQLSCIPVTIHIPFAAVPAALTPDLLLDTCRIAARDLRARFGLANPRLALAGLNPHAGEGGTIGTEEIAVIAPAVEALRREGIDAVGPLPGDTMFHAEARSRYDVAVCMYHDQALIPAKTLAFDDTVNATLGLPIVRTSPDHGTAAHLAGTGRVRPDSFLAALRLAARMAAHAGGQGRSA